jgi:undecaprenyl-diphosphatase
MNIPEKILQADTELFLTLNGLHSDWADNIMYYISQFWVWIPLYVLIILLIVRKWKKESIWIIITILIGLILTDQLSNLTKIMFERLRPSHEPALQGLVHHVKGYVGGSFSFVSGHSSNVFGVALITALVIRNRIYTVLIFLWASLVAYSRIYLGVHYPLDILGGMILGMSVTGFAYLVLKGIQCKLIAEIKSRFF